MRKPGFTIIEILLTFGILTIVAGASIPLYHNYQVRSDLGVAEDVVLQGIYRARVLTQTGQEDDVWSYNIGSGVVFKGTNYVGRDTAYDELFVVPESVIISGVASISFSRVYGVPSPTGDVVLTSLNDEKRYIPIRAYSALAGDAIPPVQFKVQFDRIKNTGQGNFGAMVFVGTGAMQYAEGVWIPLTEDGVAITDASYVLDQEGFSIQRQSGFIRITTYGGLSGGKEIVDARIMFDRGIATSVDNDIGDYETEQPFNLVVNDGVGGDEVTTAVDGSSVYFQTRSTNNGDSILINWIQSG
jgi:hypothetical protein